MARPVVRRPALFVHRRRPWSESGESARWRSRSRKSHRPQPATAAATVFTPGAEPQRQRAAGAAIGIGSGGGRRQRTPARRNRKGNRGPCKWSVVLILDLNHQRRGQNRPDRRGLPVAGNLRQSLGSQPDGGSRKSHRLQPHHRRRHRVRTRSGTQRQRAAGAGHWHRWWRWPTTAHPRPP